MSRFYGKLYNGRGLPATKCGHAGNGLSAQTNGWDIGAEVSVRDAGGVDTVEIEATAGSNGNGRRVYLAQLVRDGEGYRFTGGAMGDALEMARAVANATEGLDGPAWKLAADFLKKYGN